MLDLCSSFVAMRCSTQFQIDDVVAVALGSALQSQRICFLLWKARARWPVVSFCYCTDLTHQSEIKALTVANIKGLLLACPVPRVFFLLSILIYCRSQGGSSLIMKERMDTLEPSPAWLQSIFILEYRVIQHSEAMGHWNDWSGLMLLLLFFLVNKQGISAHRCIFIKIR